MRMRWGSAVLVAAGLLCDAAFAQPRFQLSYHVPLRANVTKRVIHGFMTVEECLQALRELPPWALAPCLVMSPEVPASLSLYELQGLSIAGVPALPHRLEPLPASREAVPWGGLLRHNPTAALHLTGRHPPTPGLWLVAGREGPVLLVLDYLAYDVRMDPLLPWMPADWMQPDAADDDGLGRPARASWIMRFVAGAVREAFEPESPPRATRGARALARALPGAGSGLP
jgi:hypothetical protein